jgi:3-isopropylmalate dehydrogenase
VKKPQQVFKVKVAEENMGIQKTIAVLVGDGIGPEIMREGVKVLEAVSRKYGHQFQLRYAPFGAEAYTKHGNVFPEATRGLVKEVDATLKGPVGLNLEGMKRLHAAGIRLENETIIALRRELDAFVGYRPVVLPASCADFSPLRREVIGDGIDILMMRELVGGIYAGDKVEGKDTGMVFARDDCTYTYTQVERFARACFEEARQRKCKLTNVHKANILATMRLWNSVFDRVSQEYQDVRMEPMLVDNVAFQLMKNPRQFNGVMALENFQGDIITDQGGGVLGSLGLMPSACFNPLTRRGFFEPSHGSAPDIAGKNTANPYSMIGSVAFMLDKSFGLAQEAKDVWDSLVYVFAAGYRTRELANAATPSERVVSTSQFGDLVVENILKRK